MTTSTVYMEAMIEAAKKRRGRVVELHRKGLTFAEIGKVLAISRQAAARLWKEAQRKGEI